MPNELRELKNDTPNAAPNEILSLCIYWKYGWGEGREKEEIELAKDEKNLCGAF